MSLLDVPLSALPAYYDQAVRLNEAENEGRRHG